jgi:hypothetical protein
MRMLMRMLLVRSPPAAPGALGLLYGHHGRITLHGAVLSHTPVGLLYGHHGAVLSHTPTRLIQPVGPRPCSRKRRHSTRHVPDRHSTRPTSVIGTVAITIDYTQDFTSTS